MSESFGRKIKRLRVEKKMTLDDLADAIGSKKAYVWQLENKTPARPSGKLLLDLAKALDVSPDYLIDDEVEEPSIDHRADALLRSVKGKGLSPSEFDQLMKIADTFGKK
jgi:transcriptional regulator with XRE-family HTH domain